MFRNLMSRSLCIIGIVVTLGFSGCTQPSNSGWGFTLPKGDAEEGKRVFVEMKCHACHSIKGIEQLAAEGEKPEQTIRLGGEVDRIQTYGELVSSIINPSHKLARGYAKAEIADEDGTSKMKVYNDAMTVSQLSDLVTYLQGEYKLRKYEMTDYPMYGP